MKHKSLKMEVKNMKIRVYDITTVQLYDCLFI